VVGAWLETCLAILHESRALLAPPCQLQKSCGTYYRRRRGRDNSSCLTGRSRRASEVPCWRVGLQCCRSALDCPPSPGPAAEINRTRDLSSPFCAFSEIICQIF